MPDGALTSPSANATQQVIAQMAAQYGGTQAIPAIQRSQYLADALQAMQQHGGENIRTPMALGSNLLADALLQYGRNRENKQLLQEIGQGQSGVASDAQQGIYAPQNAGGAAAGGAAPQATPAGPPIAGSTPPAGGGAPPAGGGAPPVPNTTLADAISPADENAAINTVYGEARGESQAGRQAVAGVLANRSHMTGLPISTIAAQPHQFAGYNPSRQLDPNSPIYQSIKGDIDPILLGEAVSPAGNADHFYAPKGMPGGIPPSWAHGQQQTPIGNQDFLSLGFGGKPPMPLAPPGPPPTSGPPSTASAAQQPPAPRPLQISTGPDPSIPSPAAVGQGSGLPGGGQSGSPPTGPYATPDETAFIQRGLSYPQGSMQWQAAVAKAQEVQQRRMTPAKLPDGYGFGPNGQVTQLTPPKDMQWGQNGQVAPIPGTQSTPLTGLPPGAAGERDAFGHTTYSTISGGQQNGQQWTGQGYAPISGLQPTQSGTPLPGTVTSTTPGQAPTVVQAPDFTPEKGRQAFLSDPAVTDYQKINQATRGFFTAVQNAGGNNGPLGIAGAEGAIQAMGLNPRTATMETVVGSMGLPEAIQSAILKATGTGSVSPEGLQQLATLMRSYDASAYQAVQARMGSDTAVNKGPVPGEAQAILPVPSMPSFGPAAGAPNPQAVIQEARQAIARGAPRAAVAARLQGMGINPAGL